MADRAPKTATEALNDVARATWGKAHDDAECPDKRIPAPADLVEWDWPKNLRDPLKEWMIDRVSSARKLLMATVVGFGRTMRSTYGWPVTAMRTIDDSELDALCLATEYGPLMARPALLYAEKRGWYFLDSTSLDWVVGTMHAEWQELGGLHPLGPLVAAWQQQTPVRVNADHSPGAILPTSLRAAQRSQVRLPLGQDRTTPLGPIREPEQGHLPDMELSPSLVPPVPWLTLYDLTGTGPVQTRGRGAPLAQRLLVEVLTAVLRADRDPDWSTAPPITLRDLFEWCWPRYYDHAASRTRGGHDRSKHLDPLRRALIELDNMRIVYDRYERRLIRVDDLPTAATRLDDPIRFYVRHLPGSDRGPMLDRASARRWGVVSAPDMAQHDTFGVSVGRSETAQQRRPRLRHPPSGSPRSRWRDPGRQRQAATQPPPRRGDRLERPARRDAWRERQTRQRRQPARVRTQPRRRTVCRLLGPDDLIRLAFDGDLVRNRRKRLHQSREALREKEAAGEVVIETAGDGWRILEPRAAKTDTWQR